MSLWIVFSVLKLFGIILGHETGYIIRLKSRSLCLIPGADLFDQAQAFRSDGAKGQQSVWSSLLKMAQLLHGVDPLPPQGQR